MIAHTDSNSIIDSGAKVTIGGSMSAAALSVAMGCSLNFKPKSKPYLHGWVKDMADSELVICTWKVELSDLNNRPFKITFDIVYSDELLLIGDKGFRHANHLRMEYRPALVIQTSDMTGEVEFLGYSNPGENRRRILVVFRPYELYRAYLAPRTMPNAQKYL